MALGAFHVFRENVFHRTRDFAGPVSLKGNLGYGGHSLHKFETACLSEAFFFRGKRLGKVRKVAMTARNQRFWLRALLTWVAFSRGVTTGDEHNFTSELLRRVLPTRTRRGARNHARYHHDPFRGPRGPRIPAGHARRMLDRPGRRRVLRRIGTSRRCDSSRSRFRLSGTVAVSLRRERARGDPLEASAPAQSSCATARAISPPTRARDDSGRRARVSRHVFPTEGPTSRSAWNRTVGRARPESPPGATSLPPSLEAHGVS